MKKKKHLINKNNIAVRVSGGWAGENFVKLISNMSRK